MNTELFVEKCFSIDNSESELLFDDKTVVESELVHCIINYLKKRFKYNVCRWEPPNQYYPNYMFLGGDKGILAYVVFQYYSGDNYEQDYLNMPLNDIVKMVSYSESRLDRPIFYLKIFNFEDKKLILFETSDQIKHRLWNDANSVKENCYIPDISSMGDIANLMFIWEELKKNGVKQY